jgi:hypothetical protein
MADESGKYVNLSGLQAFYDELKKKTSADLDFNLTSDHPIANSAISKYIAMQGSDMASLSGAASSGSAASAWIDNFTGGGIPSITATAISGQNVTANNLTSTSATITTISSTNISGDTISSTNITALTAEGNSAKYENISAKNVTATNLSSTAISATNLTALTASGTSAIFTGISAQSITGNLSGTAAEAEKLATAQNIAATGDANLSDISFDGSQGVTGKIQITNVPWSAMTNVSASGVDATTESGFVTPKQVNDAITASMSTKAAFKGPYETLNAIPTGDYDKLSIYLIGPSGSGEDKYEEYVLTADATVTGSFLKIGDTSTDLSDYLKTTAFTSWSGTETSIFSGTSRSANSAGSATTAQYAQNVGEGSTAHNATNVITSAAAGSAAWDWVTEHGDESITAFVTAAGKNVDLNFTSSTSTAGASYTAQASGYKTIINTSTYLSGSETDAYTSAFGLTTAAEKYIGEGHSAWSSVSSLINGNTISAEKIIANDGFSGTNISGANGTTSTIDNLIGSAQSGQSALNWITTNSGNMGLTPYTSAEIVDGIKW